MTGDDPRAVPCTEAVREAEAWFRADPRHVDWIEAGDEGGPAPVHALTIVRAWLARDVPDTGGRDLTAGDVREAVAGIATSPRSWSLPAPPPDDVTVVHVGGVRYTVDTPPGDPEPIFSRLGSAEQYDWHELLAEGTVVEGEPPAPEPVFAVGDRVRSKSGGTLGTVTEFGHGQALVERRVSFVDGWDRWVDVSDLDPAPEPQAAEPPRFERGFYRLARDLGGGFTAGSILLVSHVYDDDHPDDGECDIQNGSSSGTTSHAALAAAGAVRVEER